MALLQTFKDGDVADLASIHELIKFSEDFDVQKPAGSPRRTVGRVKDAFKRFATSTHGEGISSRGFRGHAIPFSSIQELLRLLDISDAYRTPSDDARRQPVRPCPFAAQGLYDRLLLARRHAWWLPVLPKRVLLLGGGGGGGGGRSRKNGNTSRRRSWYIADSELSVLLEPVVVEMRACLEYVESFCRLLETTTRGRRRDEYWVDLSELRTCVLKLTGFWPHGVEEDYPGYAFDLPSGLGMLLFPQICLDRDEMMENLEELVLGPGRDRLMRLEVIARGR
ncbi:hypothetical protein VSDG_05707 [Cytospora chrysosperma]|uniref:Uncharacterized protein n=1 Tax=Cytospora chrysosperma TaxID=252740 RepID=A0A423VTA3_CYTCH|nr:hypothetical protein VSDG_05707 [Valsa sordida]